MTSIKVQLKSSSSTATRGRIIYKITHNGHSRAITSSVCLHAFEWDASSATIVNSDWDTARDNELNRARETIKSDIRAIHQIISRLMLDTPQHTVDDIVAQFTRRNKSLSLFSFMQERINALAGHGKTGTAATYLATLNSFKRFRRSQDLPLVLIDSSLIERYEAYLNKTGLTRNTTSFYMRVLRSIYNQAASQGLIEQSQPFCNVYTGIARTKKRAIGVNEMRRLAAVDLSRHKRLEFARDVFLFSIYTRGMAFIDIAYLTPANIKDGYLTYKRHKTGRELRVKWESCMQQLVAKYEPQCTGYLFPIILNPAKSRSQYKNGLHKVNNHLKKLSSLLNIHPALTMHVARHSWASIAKNNNVPITVISEGMGHSSIQTTEIYLASLDDSIIDGANKRIINKIRNR